MKRIITVATAAFAVVALSLAVACSPSSSNTATSSTSSTASSSDSSASASASTAEWSIDSDCTTCHANQAEDGTACATHIATGKLTCTTCHTEDQITPVHEKLDSSADPSKLTKLKTTTVDTTICQGCHNMDEVKAATASSTVLTDTNGKVVNPHDLPVNDSHATIVCTDCHKQHSTTALDKLAYRECESCHHADVWECGTCHSVS